MKNRHFNLFLLVLSFLLISRYAISREILQISHGYGSYHTISGDGTKISYGGKSLPGDPSDFMIIDAQTLETLLKPSASCCGNLFLDYSGDLMIGGYYDVNLYKFNYESGGFDGGLVSTTCGSDIDFGEFAFPSICGSGAKISYMGARIEDEYGCMEFPIECPCYDRTTITDLSSGATIVIPTIVQPQISGDCTKIAGVGANGDIQIYSSDGAFISDLGVKGYIPKTNFDGSKIAFICEDGGLCMVNSDGASFVKWTDYPGYPPHNDWFFTNSDVFISYDGNKILINKDLGEIIYLNTLDGSTVNLTSEYPSAHLGRMSSDGNSGVFVARTANGNENLFYFNLTTGLTPAVNAVTIDLGRGAKIKYSNVSTGGRTDIQVDDLGQELPEGFTIGDFPVYYHVQTSAVYSGGIELCVNYDENSFGASESLIHLLQYTDGAWTDVTSSLDLDNNIICGRVASLSDFSIATGPSAWRPPAPARQKIFKGDGGDGLFCGFTGRRPGASSIFLILPLLIGLFLSRHLRAVWR